MIRYIKTFCKKAAGSICCTGSLFTLWMLPVKVNAAPMRAGHEISFPGLSISRLNDTAVTPVQDTSFKLAATPERVRDTFPRVKDSAPYIGFFDIPDRPVKGRVWALSGITVAAYANSLLVLNQFWYSGYSQRSFHTFNDSGEWLQMDKAGHIFSAYLLSKYSREIWRWTGLPRKQQIWIGGMSGLAYQSVIELLDAHSENWGWSWSDMAANTLGVAVMMSQELAWNEQRFQLKFSSFPVRYNDPVLKARAIDQFGHTWAERTLKDYNSQTYWLSLNLKSVMPESRLPRWLNIAVGYSADNMFDDYSNHWTDAGGVYRNYTWLKRKRQLILSPDLDLTKIRTKHKGVKVLFQVLNMIKIPAPALELDLNGRLKMHALYF